jgi:hypothetical protein
METVDIFALFSSGRTAKPSAREFAEYLAGSFRKLTCRINEVSLSEFSYNFNL